MRLKSLGILLVALMLTSCVAGSIPEGYDVSHEVRLVQVSRYLDALRESYLTARSTGVISREQFIQAVKIDTDITNAWNAYLELRKAEKDTPEKMVQIRSLINEFETILLRWGLGIPTEKPVLLGGN